ELANGLFWSPGGKHLGFMAIDRIKIVDLVTGAIRDLCDAGTNPGGASWSPSGSIIFGGAISPIMRVSEDGGTPIPATVIDAERETAHYYPQFLPDGKHFLFWARGVHPDRSGVYAGSLDVPPEKQIRSLLLASPKTALYAARHLLFLRGSTLFAQPFNLDRLSLEGSAVPVAENVASSFQFG